MSASDQASNTVGVDSTMSYVVLTQDKDGNPQLTLPSTAPSVAELGPAVLSSPSTADALNLAGTPGSQPAAVCSPATSRMLVLKSVDVGGQQVMTLMEADNNTAGMQQAPPMLNVLNTGPLQVSQNLKISNVHSLQPSLISLPTLEALAPLAEGEEPLYVNAKQYHRILKRREARARMEARGILPKSRSRYQHESRHKHAARRIRGANGKFLSKEEKQVLFDSSKPLAINVGLDGKIYETDGHAEDGDSLPPVMSAEQLMMTLSQ